MNLLLYEDAAGKRWLACGVDVKDIEARSDAEFSGN